MSDDFGSSAKGPIPTEQTEGPVVAGSMLERLAQAMCAHLAANDPDFTPWDELTGKERAEYADFARAALEAIREASSAAKLVGANCSPDYDYPHPHEGYRSLSPEGAGDVFEAMVSEILRGEA